MQVDESVLLPQLLRVGQVHGPPPPTPHAPHRTTELIIALHQRFTGRFRLGEGILADPPLPLLLLVAPGERHATYATGPVDCHWCVVRWSLVQADRDDQVRFLDPLSPSRRRRWRGLTMAEAGEALQLLRDMGPLAGMTTAAARLTVAAKVCALLGLWARPDGAAPPLAEAYRQLIESHACNGAIALAALARRLGRDTDHLGAVFRRAFGISPMTYRQRVRLDRARTALLEGASVAAAARVAGLPDARYLARLFRRRFGVTPRAIGAQQRLHA